MGNNRSNRNFNRREKQRFQAIAIVSTIGVLLVAMLVFSAVNQVSNDKFKQVRKQQEMINTASDAGESESGTQEVKVAENETEDTSQSDIEENAAAENIDDKEELNSDDTDGASDEETNADSDNTEGNAEEDSVNKDKEELSKEETKETEESEDTEETTAIKMVSESSSVVGMYTSVNDEAIHVFEEAGNGDSEPIMALPNYSTVGVVDTQEIDGITWDKVEYYGLTGWVEESSLVKNGTAEDAEKVSNRVYVVSDAGSVEVMQEPSESSSKLAELGYGNEVEIIASDGVWAKVAFDENEGWVKLSDIIPYLSTGYYYVNAAAEGLNMRSEPNASSDIVKVVTTGSTFKIEEFSNGWGRINSDGQEGWVILKYMKPCETSDGGDVIKEESYSNESTSAVSSGGNTTGQNYSNNSGSSNTNTNNSNSGNTYVPVNPPSDSGGETTSSGDELSWASEGNNGDELSWEPETTEE